jgi:hypothetical protein
LRDLPAERRIEAIARQTEQKWISQCNDNVSLERESDLRDLTTILLDAQRDDIEESVPWHRLANNILLSNLFADRTFRCTQEILGWEVVEGGRVIFSGIAMPGDEL